MSSIVASESKTVAENILEALRNAPEGLSDTDLRNKLGVGHQYINQVCRRAADRGWIERVQGKQTIVNRIPAQPGSGGQSAGVRLVPTLDERTGVSHAGLGMPSNSAEFEETARRYFSRLWGVELLPRSVLVAGEVAKKFDLVSADERIVGDAKWYTNIRTPAAKFSTIAEYVWLLQQVAAERRFVVFGRDQEVPVRWLERFGPLVHPVEFYFFDEVTHCRLCPAPAGE